MIRLPHSFTLTYPRLPYPTLFRSARVAIGEALVRPLVERDEALADRALAHPLFLEDGVDPRADLRHLIEPELVDLVAGEPGGGGRLGRRDIIDRKSTRLNSSH